MAQIANALVAGNETTIPIVPTDSSGNEYDSSNGLPVNVVSGASNTQYTDGATAPTHPIGTDIVFDNAGTMTGVSNTEGLPVNIIAGSSSGTQYTDGSTAPAHPIGDELVFNNGGTMMAVTASIGLPVNVVSGATKILDTGGTNELAVDASGHIGINNFPATQAANLTEINGTAISSGNALPVTVENWQAQTPVNIDQVNGATLSNSNPVPTSDVATTAGGSTPSHAISAASTNSTLVKSTAGQIYGLAISNTNSAARYFKLYNKATAPTVGTDTPVRTIQIPGNSTVICAFPVGLSFSLGIGYGATGAMGDSDTTAIGSGDLSMDVDYK